MKFPPKIFILFLVLNSPVIFADSFWSEHAMGWHWYQDPSKGSPEKTPVLTDPITEMEDLQHQVKQSLDQAVLYPTLENVENYIQLQNKISLQANRFAQVWKTVLLKSPEMDFSLKHPTNGIGKQVYLDLNHEQEEQALHHLSIHSGLFFFYRSTCPYCQRFAPIVRNFSQRYGISVIPVTTDGVSLPDFPHSRTDQGQAAQLGVTVEPALFTVDPTLNRILPVGYGLMSEDELRQRLLEMAEQDSIREISNEKIQKN